jgi:uncharacterized protein (TIGR02246 family)
MSMILNRAFSVAIVACASFFTLNAMAGDLRSEMEAENARWLKAFNTPNPDAFPAMYAKDALLFPDHEPPVTGPEAIKQFWVKTIKAGFRDHTFKIITTHRDAKIAYVVSSWTVTSVDHKGAKATYSGNTIRILERQSDGTWRTKIHMYASDR